MDQLKKIFTSSCLGRLGEYFSLGDIAVALENSKSSVNSMRRN